MVASLFFPAIVNNQVGLHSPTHASPTHHVRFFAPFFVCRRHQKDKTTLLFKVLGAINCVYQAPRNKVKFATYSRAKTAFSALAHLSKQLCCVQVSASD